MRHNRLLIDFHVHLSQYDLLLDSPREWFLSCYPSEKNYLDLCEAYGNPDSFCELLKEKGVDYAVILAENTPDVTGIASNQSIAHFCKGHPHLLPFCTFDPMREKDLGNLLRQLASMGFCGVKLYPTYNFFYPNDPIMYPLYEAAQEPNLPIMFHTGTSVFRGSRLKYGNPLFLDDIAVDFPLLRLIMCHGGRGPWYEEAISMVKLHKHLFIDISGLPPKKLPQYFGDIERLSHKFIFGTDWPSVDIGKNADAVAALPLSESGIRNILGENALTLLSLKERPSM